MFISYFKYYSFYYQSHSVWLSFSVVVSIYKYKYIYINTSIEYSDVMYVYNFMNVISFAIVKFCVQLCLFLLYFTVNLLNKIPKNEKKKR